MKNYSNKTLLIAILLACYGAGLHVYNKKLTKDEEKQESTDHNYNIMLCMAEQSDSILQNAITEIDSLNGKIKTLSKTQNKIKADSLTKEYTKQQYEIFLLAMKTARTNRQFILELAKQNNIKLNIEH